MIHKVLTLFFMSIFIAPPNIDTETNRVKATVVNVPVGSSTNAATEDPAKPGEKEEAKPFVLAPTPAQLGKAPLQRRQSQGNCLPLSFTPVIGSHVAENKREETKDSESPTKVELKINELEPVEKMEEGKVALEIPKLQIDPPPLTIKVDFAPDELPEGQECQLSASQLTPTPKSFFKKNVEDGMDK